MPALPAGGGAPRREWMSRLAWYVHRLRAMGPGEVMHRVGDRWKQLGEKRFLRRVAAFDPGPVDEKVPRLPERATVPVPLRIQLAAEAKKLLPGSWQLFGWRQAEVGAPPCWHRDPACGVVIAHDRPAGERGVAGPDRRRLVEAARYVDDLLRHGVDPRISDRARGRIRRRS